MAVPENAKQSSFLGLLLCVLLQGPMGCGILGPDDSGPDLQGDETTMLFLGSSYLDQHDIPGRVKGFADKAGKKVLIRSRLIPGLYLDFFAQEAQTATMLREREWDFVVLQGGCQNAAYPAGAEHSVYQALRTLERKARESSPGTEVIYMMPWAFEDGMTWVPNRDETYEVMQLDIRENALKWAEELDLAVAPVGMAFHKVMTTWSPPIHYLYMEDWNHPSHLGSYLAAATIWSTVFAESATEVPYDWTVKGELARDLREVASTTVLDSLAVWRIDY